MSAVLHGYAVPPGVAAQQTVRALTWSVLLFLPMLFAWHESHFQYDIYYLPADYGLTIYRLSIFSIVLLALVTISGRYPRPLVNVVLAYLLVSCVYLVFDRLTINDIPPVHFVKGLAVALIMLPIISDRHLLHVFVRLNFVLGFVLVVLSTVPVLHWLDLITLPYESVERVPAPPWSSENVDPLHFGIFGITENFPYRGHPLEVARLQGFSFEPIHWAYFVCLTISSALFLHALRSRGRGVAAWLVFGVLGIHLFFVYSTSAFFAMAAWLVALGVLYLRRRRKGVDTRREVAYGVMLLIVVPGMLIPFLLVQIPGIGLILMADDILQKGGNWETKIGYFSMGAELYTRFLPSAGPMPRADHNLILTMYIQYGYFLALPLVAFIWMLIRHALAGRSVAVMAGTALAIVANTIVVPPQFFFASGAMWLLMAIGVAHHLGLASGKRNPNHQR